MISNKVFYVNAVFNLPDDFEGERNEALQLLLNYRKEKIKDEKYNEQPSDNVRTQKDLIDMLWENSEIKCTMDSSITEYDREKDVWVSR